MSFQFRLIGFVSGIPAILGLALAAASSGAAAETRANAPSAELSPAIPGFGQLDTQPLPTQLDGDAPAPAGPVAEQPQVSAPTLAALVSEQAVSDEVAPEIKCLATAIYYEARSESLSGQLAVGRVIVNRARSGRFPSSYCGVVYQPSQFSFIHSSHGGLNARQWRNAVALAQIAHDGSWQSEAEGALYFHAARVAPAWNLHRVAKIENHIFYR